MSWARIMAPMSGARGDRRALAAAVTLAEPFGAEAAAVYVPADMADVLPWIAEGYSGGVQATAMEALKQAAAIGERSARAAFQEVAYEKRRFASLQTPVWAELSAEARLSDVVAFADEAARGRGPLAQAFQQILIDEQRPVLIARDGLEVGGCVVVAWDGGKEASRAARLVLPLLEKARRVVIAAAPRASSRHFDPARLQAYYAARGVEAELDVIEDRGDPAPGLLGAAARAGAQILAAGAFGHPRLQEFIFGGTTRTLLNADAPSLFLSH